MALKRGYFVSAVALYAASALRKAGKKQTDCYSAYDGKPLLQFSTDTQAEMDGIMNKLLDFNCNELGDDGSHKLLAICPHRQTAAVTAFYGDKVEVMEKDAGAYYRKISGGAKGFEESPGAASAELSSDFYADWRNSEARMARVEAAVANSGGAAKLEQIGSSVEGRPIMVVRFKGAGWTPGGPRVVGNCQLHAREWISGMSCVYAVEMAAKKAKEDPSWLAGAAFDMVPMSNPDGFLYSETISRMWRKNRAGNNGNRCKGVDLNRNWDPDWSGRASTSGSPCSDVYYGSAAFSEPETQAVKNLLDESPVAIHLDIHAYSELLLAPWSYTYDEHPRRAEIDVPGKAMQAAIKAVHGKTYLYGGSEVLYTASGVAPDYSTMKGAFGYTYELRPGQGGSGGFAPPANTILPTAEECLQGIYAAIAWAKDPVTTPAPAPTPVPPECPWYCNTFGCGQASCQVCPQCQ